MWFQYLNDDEENQEMRSVYIEFVSAYEVLVAVSSVQNNAIGMDGISLNILKLL